MVEMKASIEINASLDEVWNIVSNLDSEPRYWKGITSIRNISTDNNIIKREVTLNKTNKCLQTVTLYPKERVHTAWTKGLITGTKEVILRPHDNATYLETVMNYKYSGMAGLLSGKITKDLLHEANIAVELIKDQAEGLADKGPIMEERKMWADLINEDESNK